MRNIRFILGWTMVGILSFAGTGIAEQKKAGLNLPVEDLKWVERWPGVGVLVAKAWGDYEKTAHGTFMKMPAGMVSDQHTHTHDVRGVVVSGTVSHIVDGGIPEEKPLAPGSAWFTPAAVKHITKCAPGADCVFLLVMEGPHDYMAVPAEKQKQKKKK